MLTSYPPFHEQPANRLIRSDESVGEQIYEEVVVSMDSSEQTSQSYHEKYPLVGLPETTIIDKLSKGELPSYQLFTNVSTEVVNFLERCFKFERTQRPSAMELLSDQFINGEF